MADTVSRRDDGRGPTRLDFLCASLHKVLTWEGRSDLSVDPKTVDIGASPPGSDHDDYEKSISRSYAYFVRNARNIRLITDLSQKLKKKKDWGLDPEFVGYNQAFRQWPYELPPDLQLSLPPDGSVPHLASHFVGNMHTHWRLGIVMLRRPQLVAAKSFSDEAWREQLSQCYTSSKVLCRLQEAILQQFGATGLLCMVRGINFTVYAILTCTMIHMVSFVHYRKSKLLNYLDRLPSPLPTQLSIPTLESSSPAICVYWSNALRGQCQRPKTRSRH